MISCPTDAAKIAPGIFPYDPKFPPPPIQGTLINIATVVSSGGVPYLIYAGAGNDPQQGIIVVEEQPTDVCALTAGIVPPPPEPKWYQTPSKAGVVTLSQIEGDAVLFTTADGATGRFDYTKGEFSAQPAAP